MGNSFRKKEMCQLLDSLTENLSLILDCLTENLSLIFDCRAFIQLAKWQPDKDNKKKKFFF